MSVTYITPVRDNDCDVCHSCTYHQDFAHIYNKDGTLLCTNCYEQRLYSQEPISYSLTKNCLFSECDVCHSSNIYSYDFVHIYNRRGTLLCTRCYKGKLHEKKPSVCPSDATCSHKAKKPF